MIYKTSLHGLLRQKKYRLLSFKDLVEVINHDISYYDFELLKESNFDAKTKARILRKKWKKIQLSKDK